MSKKAKPTPAPPTVLVITLEADGNGSLLTRRGELAHLSQFTYRGMSEIITAIQFGAVALGQLEQNPPTVEVTSAETENESHVAATEQVSDPEPVAVAAQSDSQAQLF